MQPFLVPPFPYRSRDWSPVWTSFVGRRASNSVYGWPDEAFDVAWRTRRVLGYTVHLVSDPDAIGRVLLHNKANYERPALIRRLLRGALGEGLFNAEGESWREQQRIVAPTFSPAAVAGFAEPIAQVAQSQIAGWSTSTRPMDMAAEATAATMAIIAATLFDGDKRLTAPAAAGHITAMLDAAGRARVTALLGMPALGPGSSRARAGGRFLRDTLGALAVDRLRSVTPAYSLLTDRRCEGKRLLVGSRSAPIRTPPVTKIQLACQRLASSPRGSCFDADQQA